MRIGLALWPRCYTSRADGLNNLPGKTQLLFLVAGPTIVPGIGGGVSYVQG
jgi:hypothetical protein